jgi:pseudomonalisin
MNRPRLAPTLSPSRFSPPAVRFHRPLSHLWLPLLFACACSCLPAAAATVPNLITKPVDTGLVTPLAQHHPSWAVAANQISQVPADQDLEQLTLVLSRPAAQQQAFEQLLADQQNASSPSYHKWLTATEIGTRFGVSDSDIAAISSWLASQSLHVNFVSPDRTQVGFGGTAANIDQAFGATLAYYNVHGQQRLSVGSEPTIPQALSASIKSVRGLFAVGERPFHAVSALTSASPELTTTDSKGNVYHFLTPADFSTIYNIPSSYTGAGYTIGIVSWARVSTADLDNFRSKTSTSFSNPTEVIPTAYGGTDPGTACTTTTCSSTKLSGQEEATLDVIRAGSTAPGANLLLVASTATTASNDGIGADAQYIVYNNAANILSISFGACESDAGSSNVTFWDNLFSTAAAEGIGVFVSSGDSAAAGCDTAFAIPGSVVANSPNYICSSQYATCVGGTQFADTTSPSTYWSSSNTSGYKSVISYIPEGGWNESDTSGIAGSGGGVSTFIATPTWQTGTGVPSARAGRYTPDVSFSSSDHDGYFACMAARDSSCVTSSGSFGFLSFSGTSAAAPGMAGVAALLNQKMGAAQGNLNPKLYSLAATAASAFHDVTVSTSGVSSCSISTPSICNSSIYYTSSGAVQPGFLVTTGYDEVTGLGSLDVANFLTAYSAAASAATPTVTVTPGSSSITTAQSLSVTVNVSGASGTPTGSVTLSSGNYTSSATALSSGSATVTIPAGSLSIGTDTLTAAYTPDSSSASSFNLTTGTASVTVTQPVTGSFTLSGNTITISKGSSGTTSITVTPANGFTGAVALTAAITASPTSAQYKPTLSFGSNSTVTITGASAVTSTLTATAASTTAAVHMPPSPASHWQMAAGLTLASLVLFIAPVKLRRWRNWMGCLLLLFAAANALVACGGSSISGGGTTTKTTPTVTVSPASSSITNQQSLAVTTTVSGAPSGSIVLSGGGYTSSATTLASGSAAITIPAGSLSIGSDTLTAAYTPDSSASASYNSASGSNTVTVQGISTTGTYTVTITGTSGSTTASTTLSLVVQ